MKFELDEYHRGVTDEELVAELQRVASGGMGYAALVQGAFVLPQPSRISCLFMVLHSVRARPEARPYAPCVPQGL
jgi:hypothetical protein